MIYRKMHRRSAVLLHGKIGDQMRNVLLATVLIIGSTALAVSMVLIAFANGQRYESASETFSYVAGELRSSLDDAETVVRMMAYDTNLANCLMTLRYIDADTRKGRQLLDSVRQSVANYCGSNNYISYINLWQCDAVTGCHTQEKVVRFSRYAPISTMLDAQQREQLAVAALENSGFGSWVFLREDPDGVYYVRLVRTIDGFEFVNLGIVAVRVNLQRLINDLAKSQDVAWSRIILLGKGDVLHLGSTKDLTSMEAIYRQVWNSRSEYQVAAVEKHRYFVVKTQITPLNMLCCYMVLYDQPYRMALLAYGICIFSVLAVLGMVLLLSNRMMRNITRHFDTLYYKMDVYSRGCLESPDVGFDYAQGTDELSLAHRHLDEMAAQIRRLIDDNYVKQLRIREAAFQALEQQINPHFLYNTLSSIQWQAASAGQTQICAMVQALGNMMRFSLAGADVVTIQDELAVVGDYMTIQKLRYEDRLQWTAQADPALMHMKIPKMTIQPLVENAIKHGLEQMMEEVCVISVQIWTQHDALYVQVSNNGSVFEEGLLEKLRAGQMKAQGLGIGMLNIDERIRLLCGPQYGLETDNCQGCAVVRAVLSTHLNDREKETEHVENDPG
jgi:two-component system sensor histidine kinase YesM